MTKAPRSFLFFPAPDRGASVTQYLAALLLIAVVTGALMATGDVSETVAVKTRGAICRAFQGGGCEEEVPGGRPSGEPSGDQAPGGETSGGEAPGTDIGSPAGAADPPGSPAGSADEPLPSEPAAPALTPELLGDYQQCRRGVPPDFEAVMGYRPSCVDSPGGRRAIHPEGECSAPILGNSGRSFDFTVPCQSHDFGYDLQRYYRDRGAEHSRETRREADRQFREDVFAHCEQTRSGFNEWSCKNWAGLYSSAVEWVARLQDHQVP